jgi:hypothetical protein
MLSLAFQGGWPVGWITLTPRLGLRHNLDGFAKSQLSLAKAPACAFRTQTGKGRQEKHIHFNVLTLRSQRALREIRLFARGSILTWEKLHASASCTVIP